jgi:hypothetical protein
LHQSPLGEPLRDDYGSCRRTAMNLFTIIGVIVVAVFVLGYFGLR